MRSDRSSRRRPPPGRARSSSRRSTSTRTRSSPSATASRASRAVKAFRNGQVVGDFVGALPRSAVSEFLDGLTGPSPAERVVAELRESGELPAVADAVEEGDHERAFELLLEEIPTAEADRRDWLRGLAVALFGDLGHEHPLTLRYRRRLAAVLY